MKMPREQALTRVTAAQLLSIITHQSNSRQLLTECLVSNGRIRKLKVDHVQIELTVSFELEVCYKRLFKLLIDKDMRTKDLAEKSGVSLSILNKMRKGEGSIDIEIWDKLCLALNCSIVDILELIPAKE